MDDPYRILGIAGPATAAELRRARNQLAKRLHPDASGASSEAMAAVNAAYEAALASQEVAAAFSLDVLPVDAFEVVALAVAAAGELLDADEPYSLEGYLVEPGPCFCRFELAPEAGGTLVTVTVGAAEAVAPPTASSVVAALFP